MAADSRATPSTMAASMTWPRPEAGPLDQRRAHPEGQQQAAPAEVGQQVERRRRRLAGPTDVGQRPGQAHVVEVVPGLWASGPSWPQPVMRA